MSPVKHVATLPLVKAEELRTEYAIRDKDGSLVALVQFAEDAEFIIHACNCHANLMNALRLIADQSCKDPSKLTAMAIQDIAMVAIERAGGGNGR